MNLSTADLRWTEFHETWLSYRYMFLVGPKNFQLCGKGGQSHILIFQCRKSIRDIIIYPHIKFWWYLTMLNFYRPFFMQCFGSHFENAELLL
jgi:hypothetical protein